MTIFDVNVALANLKFHAVRAASEYICTQCEGLLKKINDLQQILEELQKSMGINYATTLKKVRLGKFVDGLQDSHGALCICSFAVFFSVSRPFCRFTRVYEGHFMLMKGTSCCVKGDIRAVQSCYGKFSRGHRSA